MNRRFRDTVRTALSALFSLLLLVQGLSPAGYMPASLDSGWLVMLCPEGLPTRFLAGTEAGSVRLQPANVHRHGHHAEAASGQDAPPADDHHSGTDYCELGSALDTPALTTYVDPIIDRLPPPAYGRIAYTTPLVQQRLLLPRPRAPPTV